MILAHDIKEIMEKFDFTDSIITEIKWENNLFDLVLVVDYYWDIEEGRENTRSLKIRFKNCVKADFQMTLNLIDIPENEIDSYSFSWFTIVLLRHVEYISDKLMCMEICTTDYDKPWLIVVCKNMQIEEDFNGNI